MMMCRKIWSAEDFETHSGHNSPPPLHPTRSRRWNSEQNWSCLILPHYNAIPNSLLTFILDNECRQDLQRLPWRSPLRLSSQHRSCSLRYPSNNIQETNNTQATTAFLQQNHTMTERLKESSVSANNVTWCAWRMSVFWGEVGWFLCCCCCFCKCGTKDNYFCRSRQL